ncbi:MAG: excisionase family DNA-binding protein [Coriobacteriia bacterium]|nr:excisionase family DNA-binding protein [Coriobacteriia bacterium]
MQTVEQAAEYLGVSQTRVRKMIYDGVLPAERFGRIWSIPDAAVISRHKSKPGSGRPKKDSVKDWKQIKGIPYTVQNLYHECRNSTAYRYEIDSIMNIATPEEKDFYIAIADFFLQQKQKQLINAGVY